MLEETLQNLISEIDKPYGSLPSLKVADSSLFHVKVPVVPRLFGPVCLLAVMAIPAVAAEPVPAEGLTNNHDAELVNCQLQPTGIARLRVPVPPPAPSAAGGPVNVPEHGPPAPAWLIVID